ncbi:hypothetical protein SpAn4DRAFT_1279 [Sporomusa ovata]|uniref:Uncharacterized protein n=1 Tax=Sporomusa ovata TaxID=2378 RepID=A0A0U1KSA2_9FIRM|nr:hypothetical protein SpAn4DRAFT_1279 [Sporomusa ovata]
MLYYLIIGILVLFAGATIAGYMVIYRQERKKNLGKYYRE